MNHREFCTIFLPMKDRIYRYAKVILCNTEEAEDLTQDFYEKLWLRHAEFGSEQCKEAYVFRSVRNLCLDRLKSRRRFEDKTAVLASSQSEEISETATEWSDMPEWFDKVLASMPEKNRQIVHLRDVEGLEMEKISEIMDVEIPSLRVLLSRSRKLLREKMTKIMEYGL